MGKEGRRGRTKRGIVGIRGKGKKRGEGKRGQGGESSPNRSASVSAKVLKGEKDLSRGRVRIAVSNDLFRTELCLGKGNLQRRIEFRISNFTLV